MRFDEISQKPAYGLDDFEHSRFKIKVEAAEQSTWQLDQAGNPVIILRPEDRDRTFPTKQEAFKFFLDPFFGVLPHEQNEAEVAKLILFKNLKPVYQRFPEFHPDKSWMRDYNRLPKIENISDASELDLDLAGGLAHDVIIAKDIDAYRKWSFQFP